MPKEEEITKKLEQFKEENEELKGKLDKMEDKDKDWRALRDKVKAKDEKIETLESQLNEIKNEAEQAKREKQIDSKALELAGGNQKIAKKIKDYFNQFKEPDIEDKEKRQEILEERWESAKRLATAGKKPQVPSGTGSGRVPGAEPPKPEGGKLDEEAVEVAKKLGIKEDELKDNNLI